jgi:hypothetical protein
MATATTKQARFEKDVQAYLLTLPQLLRESEGKFVLVGAAELAGIFDVRDDAMAEGYKRFGDQGFLVRPISRDDLEMARQMPEACLS